MVFDITHLKKIRKQLNLTQHQFAKTAGLSQSLIAKIESGKLDPTYSKVKKIEQALEILAKKHEKEAREIMVRKIISVQQEEKATKIIEVMNKHSVSQIPILEKDKVIGIVSESSLSRGLEEIKLLKARDIMEEAPPIMAKDTKLEVIKNLLQHYSLVLVKEKGKLIGLITKADFIKSLV
jgi:predicted transcriptional regulator